MLGTGKALTLHAGRDGKPQYDAIVHQGLREDQHVQSKFTDLVPLSQRDDLKDRQRSIDRPSEEEVLSTAERTRLALESIVHGKVKSTQPKNVPGASANTSYLRYTPASQGPDGKKQRIIKMTEVVEDPLEPPKHRFKKVPNGPPSPPAPVLRSPPRKVTAQEQKEWMIPPCISNWKNNKGYTIPLDKRLAASGRGMQDVEVNDNFAQFAEALNMADRHAREEVRQRNIMQQKIAAQEKAAREESLRMLAQRARDERAGISSHDDRLAHSGSALTAYGSSESDDEDDEDVAQRNRLREERRRERERELRMSNMGQEQRARAFAKEQNRDISEKVALGLAKPTMSKESMTDARLFNREALSNTFGDDDSYNVYDKPLFQGSSAAAAIYKRPGTGGSDEMFGSGTESGIQNELQHDRFGLGVKRGFKGTESKETRSGPVQFEKDDSDPFAIDQFLDEAKRGIKRSADESNELVIPTMSVFQNWIDGFKPAVTDGEYADPSEGDIEQEGASFPLKPSHDVTSEDLKGIKPTKRPMLKKELKSRHLAFIALGGGIGTGLFVGAGSKLYQGGPGSIIIDYTLMGIMILTVLFALGELATLFPTPGAFSAYSTRFIDPAAGFAIGYNYFMSWCSTLPLEFTAAAIVVRYWNHDKLDPDKEGPMPNGALVAIFWVLVILINLFGARGYAEFEFIATSFKMLVLVGFIIYAAVVDCGGTSGTDYKYLGARYWHDPGAFNNGFKGFCNVFTTAAFAFTGTEVLGLAVAESSNPRKAMPRACKLVLYRVITFYALALFMVTLLVPYNTPDLHGKTDNDPKSSPFVIAIKAGQVNVLPDIVNAVIMLSAISVSNSAAYAGSRTLHALADNGMAPQIFAYVDRQGRPLVATLFTLMFGALAFLIYVGDDNGGEVFSWLLGISGLAILFTWSSICISHIRFRAAWKLQGHSLSELPWLSPLGVVGSYIGLTFNVLVIIAQFYNSAFPIGEGEKNGNDRGYNFFLGMISLPIIMVFFFGYKIVKKTKIIPLHEIDLVSGIREQISLEEHDQERAERQNWPIYKKVLHFLF